MAQDGFGARRFLLETLLRERSLDRDALEECEKIRKENNQMLSEVLVSEGTVTDQELGRLLEKFAADGYISPAELGLLKEEFSSNWERWKEMEERDKAAGVGTGEIPSAGPAGPPGAGEGDTGMHAALEELMAAAPVRERGPGRGEEPQGAGADEGAKGRRIAGCTILEKLGEGRLGSVYKGVLEALGKAVAVRLIPVETMSESRRERLLETVRTASRIEQGNVAEVISAGEDGDQLYIVSRFVEGESLRERLLREVSLPQEDALEVALAVARGLRAGHSLGILHADIKPENIFFDHESRVLITNFGIVSSAETQAPGSPKEALLAGSPHYMAPELFEARPPDARTDIYSLGVTLYEMLTGAHPFGGASATAIKDAHLRGRPKPPTSVNNRVGSAVSKLVAKMIAREPESRYQETTELIDDMIGLVQHLTSGGEQSAAGAPEAVGPEAASPPGFAADIRARASRYKTVAASPEVKKTSRLVVKLILILVLAAVSGVLYVYYARPDFLGIFKQEEVVEFEDSTPEPDKAVKAEEALKDLKSKVDFSLSQGKYLETLQLLAEFPPRYTSPAARREIEACAIRVAREADDDLKPMQARVQELEKEKRYEDALRINRDFKSRVEQIVNSYCGLWPQLNALKKYLEWTTKTRKRIGRIIHDREHFEKEMNEADQLLEENKFDPALVKVQPYLDSPIEEYRKKAQRLRERIIQEKMAYKKASDKKVVWEAFEKVLQQARQDKDEERFDEALKRIEQFLFRDEPRLTRGSGKQWDFDDALRRSIERLEGQKGKIPLEILLEAEDLIPGIKKARKEFAVRKKEEERKERFKADIEYARKAIREKRPQDARVVVQKHENDRRLTAQEREALAALEEVANRHIRFFKDLKKIKELLAAGECNKARQRILLWLSVEDKAIAQKVKAKYLEIMDAMEPGMTYIEGKEAVFLGSDDTQDNNPRRLEGYRTFYIDRCEVTCGDYNAFVEAAKHAPPANWPAGRMPDHLRRLPVTGVSWEDASAYAKWKGKRLPTDAEWEIAASWDGSKKILYPWGESYVAGNANIATGELEKVGSRPKDFSPNGVFDMAGNAAEWTATKSGDQYFVRGSCADKTAKASSCRTTRRSPLDPQTTSNLLGFRCVKDPK